MTDKKTYIDFDRLKKFVESDIYKLLDETVSAQISDLTLPPIAKNLYEAASDLNIQIKKISILTNNESSKSMIISKTTFPELETPIILTIKDGIDKLNDPTLDVTNLQLPINNGRNILPAESVVSESVLQRSLKKYLKISADEKNLTTELEEALDISLGQEINTSQRVTWSRASKAREFHRDHKPQNVDPNKPLATVISLADRVKTEDGKNGFER